ncbi:MAG TPA: two-component regulator propeller domain-containing protein, partial [Bryobacteraceae bacterium]|nr:two-component regulator propeller domain-containing protein [Bryobacteraceae bacterium]
MSALFACAAYGMDPGRAMSQYARDSWGPDQDFPRGPVYAITQTPDGYLWIGAEAGLIRFDGWNFVLVTDRSRKLQISNVLGLEPAADGGLWVRTQSTALLHYRDGVFTSVGTVESGTNITAMSRTAQGELIVAKAEGQTFAYRAGKFILLDPGGSLPRSPVLSLAQNRDGDLWMGTRDAGLFRVSADTTSSIRSGLPDPKVNCVLPDGNRGLWVGTDAGIVRWDGAELTPAGLPANTPRFQALAMVRDRDGNLWVGTDSRGLLRVNAAGTAWLDDASKGSRPAVTTIFEDREGNLWTGSAGRLERLRDTPFVSFSTPEGLPSDGSNPVYVDAENRMWFPPIGGGLWWVKNGQHGTVAQAGLANDIVYSIAGRGDELWLGRQHGGLTRLHWGSSGPESSLQAETYTSANGLAQNSVYSVYEARDGTVWAGTLSGGVSRLKDGKFTTYTIAQGLASNTVASILETANGVTWFATPNGLSALADDRWTSYATRDGLPSDNVNCLYEDSTGVLWAGTAAGLAFRRSASFQSLTGVPQSLREEIFGLAEDRYGSLWISTSNHVLRVNRDRLIRGRLTAADVRE